MFDYPSYVLLPGLILSLLLAFLMIRPDRIPGKAIKIIFLLRSLIILLLLLAILGFTVNWKSTVATPPSVAVLVDGTRSIALQQAEPDKELIQALEKKLKENHFRPFIYIFGGDTLIPFENWNGNFDLEGTDLGLALEKIQKLHRDDNLQGVILISDGQYNIGKNPLPLISEELPLYTVGIGDSSISRTPSIKKINYNPKWIKGVRDSLTIYLQSSNNPFHISIYVDDTLEVSQIVPGDSSTRLLKKMTFYLSSNKIGHVLIKIELQPLNSGDNPEKKVFQGETLYRSLQVIPDEYKVFLYSPAPDFTTRLLTTRILKKERFSVNVFFKTGTFQQALTSINPGDLIILKSLRFPPHVMKRLLSIDNSLILFPHVEEKSQLQQLLQSTAIKLLPLSEPLYPLANITPAINLFLPLLPLTEIEQSFTRLPPLEVNFLVKKYPPELITLIQTISSTGKYPLIQYGTIKNRKVLLIYGNQLWKWFFKTLGTPLNASVEELFSALLDWLTEPVGENKIFIKPNRQVYKVGERITFEGFLLDETGKITTDKPLQLEITGKYHHLTRYFSLEKGQYQTGFIASRSDTLNYLISIPDVQDSTYQARGRIIVVSSSIEENNLYQNSSLLDDMARKSGRTSLKIDQLLQFNYNFPQTQQIEIQEHSITFWDNFPYILLIIILFSLEIILRKYYGFL